MSNCRREQYMHLTEEQFNVCWKKGTEQPFSGKYWDCKTRGVYWCVCCKKALFTSDTKYESGSGWPSFFAPIHCKSIKTKEDDSLDILRVEVVCAGCGAHLGHLFADGPEPTGLRYCINSAALQLDVSVIKF